jgi:hypothetical protein
MVIEAQSPIAELLAKDPVLLAEIVKSMTCSWRWFIHPETAISRKRNGSKTLWGFKAHYRDYGAMVEPSVLYNAA